MTFGSRRMVGGAAAAAAVWVLSIAFVAGQAPAPAQNQMLAENVFKNITELRGIPVDEFMGTMGVFSAALGLSCENCHTASSNDWGLYANETPRKQTARRMIRMMAAINKEHFGGRQVVTCFTCHHGSSGQPRVTSSLDILYGAPPPDELDVLLPPAPPGGPTAVQILDKYIAAVGGAQRLAALKSYVAKGMYAGYGPEGAPRPVEIYAKAPNQKSVIVRDPGAGDNTTTFSGTAGWVSAPFRPIAVLELHGAELDSVRAEAELTFPGTIKQALTGMRTGIDFINDRSVVAIQGNKGMAIVTMYFDQETGLLTRLVRSTPSPVGRLPTRTDFSDYRDVAGVKMAFKWTTAWLDGRSTFELSGIQPNVAIEAARFARPAPAKPY